MDGVWLQLLLVGVLVLFNAGLSGSELALVSLREGQIERLSQRSANGAALARLARDPNRFLATIQVGITLAGFLASASAAVSLAEPLEEPLSFLGEAAGPASVLAVTLVLAYLTLVFGELAPKRLAMQRAEGWGLIAARPLAVLASVTRPAVWMLSRSTDLVVRILGGDPNREREAVTQQELRDLVAVQASFSPQQRTIIDGAFEIAERTLREVIRPRADVFVLDAATPAGTALAELAASGHSRAPVAAGRDLDQVVGVVHLRALWAGGERTGGTAATTGTGTTGTATAGSVASPATVLPETVGVLDGLRAMQAARVTLACVIDEHGAVEGIVTMEDLVEELVGEIYDEADRDVSAVEHRADGTMVLPGRYPFHDLVDLGVEVPVGPYATVAGFLLDRLQRLPDEAGDVVDEGGWRFTVTRVEERAITTVTVSPAPPPG